MMHEFKFFKGGKIIRYNVELTLGMGQEYDQLGDFVSPKLFETARSKLFLFDWETHVLWLASWAGCLLVEPLDMEGLDGCYPLRPPSLVLVPNRFGGTVLCG